jgi:hypothetical protein
MEYARKATLRAAARSGCCSPGRNSQCFPCTPSLPRYNSAPKPLKIGFHRQPHIVQVPPANDPQGEQIFEEEDDDLDLSDLRDMPPDRETVRERLQKAAKRRTTKQQEKNWHDTPVNVTPSGRHEILEDDGELDDADANVDEVTVSASGRHEVVDEDIDIDMSDLDEATLGGYPSPATRIEEELDLAGLRAAPPLTAGPMTMAAFDMGGADEPQDDTHEPKRPRADSDTETIARPAAKGSGPMTMAAVEMYESAGDETADETDTPNVNLAGVSLGDEVDPIGSGPMTQAAIEMESDIEHEWRDQAGKSGSQQKLPSGETDEALLDKYPQLSEPDPDATEATAEAADLAAGDYRPPVEVPDEQEEATAADYGSDDSSYAVTESVELDLQVYSGKNAASGSTGEDDDGAVSDESSPATPSSSYSQPEDFTVADDSGAPLGRGLDVGTANLVAARMDEEGSIEFFPARNAFLDVPEDPYTLKMLKGQGVPYIKRENKLFIIGEDAFELANIFNREMRRPMKNGLISPTDADAMPMEVELFKKILGPPRADGEVVYYSIPADPVDSTMNIVYHTNIANGLLERLGYRGHPFNEGQAIVFSELGDDDFTGIGISCGGGMVNVCVTFRSMPVVSFSSAKGGDWIDQQAAQVMGCAASKITAVKERGVDINAPKTPEEEAIVIYYRHLIKYSLDNIVKKFESTKDIPNFPKPVPIAISGGTSKVGGFVEVFKDEFSKLASRFPIKISDIRKAEDQLNATAKGCLLAALSHEE